MAETSSIAWTTSTFNPWLLVPQLFAALQFALVADAVRFEVAQFVADMAKRRTVIHIVGQFRKVAHRLLVMRAQISASIISAIPAAVAIALKHRLAPSEIFWLTAEAQVSLEFAAAESIVRGAAWRPLPHNRADLRACLNRMFLAEPIRWPAQRGFSHFSPRFSGHRGAFTHG